MNVKAQELHHTVDRRVDLIDRQKRATLVCDLVVFVFELREILIQQLTGAKEQFAESSYLRRWKVFTRQGHLSDDFGRQIPQLPLKEMIRPACAYFCTTGTYFRLEEELYPFVLRSPSSPWSRSQGRTRTSHSAGLWQLEAHLAAIYEKRTKLLMPFRQAASGIRLNKSSSHAGPFRSCRRRSWAFSSSTSNRFLSPFIRMSVETRFSSVPMLPFVEATACSKVRLRAFNSC